MLEVSEEGREEGERKEAKEKEKERRRLVSEAGRQRDEFIAPLKDARDGGMRQEKKEQRKKTGG